MTIIKNCIKVPTSEARDMIKGDHESYDLIDEVSWESRYDEDFCDFIVQNKLDFTLWSIATRIIPEHGAEFLDESKGFVTLHPVKPIQKTVTEYVSL